MNECACAETVAMGLLLAGVPLFPQSKLTIYNQNFGVVREQVSLELKPGINEIRLTNITAHLDPAFHKD